MAVEFGVHSLPALTSRADRHTVVGRVMAGTVRVGDVFTEAEGPRDRWATTSPGPRAVDLTVVEVRRFEGVLCDEAEEMFSAQLLLEGSGHELLSSLVVLRHHDR